MRLVVSMFAVLCLAALGYAAFTVELGDKTLVEHGRAIAATREAKALASGAREEAGRVAEQTAVGAAKAAHATRQGAEAMADTVAGGVKQVLGKGGVRLSPREHGADDEPAVKVVERPAPTSPRPQATPPSPTAPKPGGATLVGPPAPTPERLDDADRKGPERPMKRAAR